MQTIYSFLGTVPLSLIISAYIVTRYIKSMIADLDKLDRYKTVLNTHEQDSLSSHSLSEVAQIIIILIIWAVHVGPCTVGSCTVGPCIVGPCTVGPCTKYTCSNALFKKYLRKLVTAHIRQSFVVQIYAIFSLICVSVYII